MEDEKFEPYERVYVVTLTVLRPCGAPTTQEIRRALATLPDITLDQTHVEML